MKTVKVKFDSYGKEYSYLYPYTDNIVKGDVCVVLVNDEYKCVKVYDVVNGEDIQATRPVVCKVDILGYHDFLEKDRKRKNLKALLDKKVKEFNELAVYEALLKHDSTAADLVKQLKELS